MIMMMIIAFTSEHVKSKQEVNMKSYGAVAT